MAGKKILLVEDDTNLREIYGARLQAEGYDIVSAPDGENALAIAVKEKPDLIISDIMMPKVSGFDMLDILRNAPETKDTKIIMMTALSQAEDKARADKLGADMYLVKSQVTLEDVTKAVHQILDDPSDSTQEAESAETQKMVSGNNDTSKTDTQPEPPKPEPEVEKSAETPKEEPKPPEPPTPAEPPKPVEPPKPEPAPPEPSTPKPEPVATPPAQAPADNPPPNTPTTSINDRTTNIPVNTGSDDDQASASAAVEPNLAQALEEEEKSLKEKINDFENSEQNTSDTGSASPPSSNDQSVVVKPDDQDKPASDSPPASDNSQPANKSNDKPENPLSDKPAKKVIEPINDPTKGPDINELVAQEEAREAAGNNQPTQANEVIKPQESDGANNQASNDTKDDFGKISL